MIRRQVNQHFLLLLFRFSAVFEVILDLGFCAAGPERQHDSVREAEGDHVRRLAGGQHGLLVRLGVVVAGRQVTDRRDGVFVVQEAGWILKTIKRSKVEIGSQS